MPVASQYKNGLMPASYCKYNSGGQALNFNDCRELWRHYSSLSGTNAPSNGYIGFFNVGYSSDWFVQIAFVVQNGGTYKIFRRCYHSGNAWTNWTEVNQNTNVPTDRPYCPDDVEIIKYPFSISREIGDGSVFKIIFGVPTVCAITLQWDLL